MRKHKGSKKAAAARSHASAPPLAEYGRAWALVQLVPFVDKLLGLAGAMDNRMISPHDFQTRLPLVLLCIAYPTRATLLVAHAVNIVACALLMPAVWDHMVWAMLLEVFFTFSALLGKGDAAVARRWLPTMRAMLLVLYTSAGFWKLTSSWFDERSSCATILMSEMLSSPVFPPLPKLQALYTFLVKAAPALIAALELAVPLLLYLSPRFGMFLALLFHQAINLLPMTYAGGFSIAMCARLHVFLDAPLTSALKPSLSGWVVPVALTAMVVKMMLMVHGKLDSAGSLFILLSLLYIRAIVSGTRPPPRLTNSASGATYLRACGWGVAVVYGFVGPVLGVQAMASSTMYANLKQFAGSNHYLLPTGLLQDRYADRTVAPAAAADDYVGRFEGMMMDAFGGGLLRVDYTNSKLMQRITPAEVTDQRPPRAQELLEATAASGRYFEMYTARNYVDRPMFNLSATKLHARGAGKRLPPLAYVVPAFELRRVIALARERGEDFVVRYTKIPRSVRTVSAWRTFQGEKVEVIISTVEPIKCTLTAAGAEAVPCSEHEAALLPPPPRWLQWVFLPYPVPLVPGETHDEILCST